jgi:hypothetical protein
MEVARMRRGMKSLDVGDSKVRETSFHLSLWLRNLASQHHNLPPSQPPEEIMETLSSEVRVEQAE